MVTCMETGYANVHRGLHFMANAATEGFEGARETTRQFLNAASTDEIIFTRNATEAYNLVASSMGWAGMIGEGDEIILSIMEHHSNIVPWHFLRERRGAVIKWAPVDDQGNFLVEEYEKLFSPRTKMVAITHMSNVLGTVTPAAEIVRIAHAHGVPVLLDGAQSAVHQPVDVRALDCDFFVFTGHKVYGPTGIGVLAFEMKGTHAHDIATVIDRQGVAVRAGTHCAMPLLNRFGVTSTCRASFGLYNTTAEIDTLAEALGKAEMLFT